MKIPLNSDIEEYKKTLMGGALKGAVTGLAFGTGVAFYLKKRTSFFVGAGGFQRMLVYAAPSAFCTIVNMELTSRSFEQHARLKQHGTVPQEARHKNADIWEQLSNWGTENKYRLIVGGWAASLGGSFYLVNRDPYMTKAQKIVQARVYAQGLTVLLLVGSVFLSVSDTKANKDKIRAAEMSKSWERDIEYVETANHPHGENASTKDKQAYSNAEGLKKLNSGRAVDDKKAKENKEKLADVKQNSSTSDKNAAPKSSETPSEQPKPEKKPSAVQQ